MGSKSREFRVEVSRPARDLGFLRAVSITRSSIAPSHHVYSRDAGKRWPFAETKELLAGFWLWQVKSMEGAIEWLNKAPFDGGTEIEVLQVFEAADFGAALTPELREQEERLRARTTSRNP